MKYGDFYKLSSIKHNVLPHLLKELQNFFEVVIVVGQVKSLTNHALFEAKINHLT